MSRLLLNIIFCCATYTYDLPFFTFGNKTCVNLKKETYMKNLTNFSQKIFDHKTVKQLQKQTQKHDFYNALGYTKTFWVVVIMTKVRDWTPQLTFLQRLQKFYLQFIQKSWIFLPTNVTNVANVINVTNVTNEPTNKNKKNKKFAKEILEDTEKDLDDIDMEIELREEQQKLEKQKKKSKKKQQKLENEEIDLPKVDAMYDFKVKSKKKIENAEYIQKVQNFLSDMILVKDETILSELMADIWRAWLITIYDRCNAYKELFNFTLTKLFINRNALISLVNTPQFEYHGVFNISEWEQLFVQDTAEVLPYVSHSLHQPFPPQFDLSYSVVIDPSLENNGNKMFCICLVCVFLFFFGLRVAFFFWCYIFFLV